MVYFRCYLVNPHVQVVQNMYAELRTAEVDPRFIKKLPSLRCQKNVSPKFFEIELAHLNHFFPYFC